MSESRTMKIEGEIFFSNGDTVAVKDERTVSIDYGTRSVDVTVETILDGDKILSQKVVGKTPALTAIHEGMSDLHAAGMIDAPTMQDFNQACLENNQKQMLAIGLGVSPKRISEGPFTGTDKLLFKPRAVGMSEVRRAMGEKYIMVHPEVKKEIEDNKMGDMGLLNIGPTQPIRYTKAQIGQAQANLRRAKVAGNKLRRKLKAKANKD